MCNLTKIYLAFTFPVKKHFTPQRINNSTIFDVINNRCANKK